MSMSISGSDSLLLGGDSLSLVPQYRSASPADRKRLILLAMAHSQIIFEINLYLIANVAKSSLVPRPLPTFQ